MVKKRMFTLGLFTLLAVLPIISYAQSVSVMYPAVAFRQMWHGTNYQVYRYNGTIEIGSSYYSNYFECPIYVPQGKRIYRMDVYCKDNGDNNIAVYVYRRNQYTQVEQLIGSLTTWDNSELYRIFTTYSVGTRINMDGYSYYIRVWMPSDYWDGSDWNYYTFSAIRLIYVD